MIGTSPPRSPELEAAALASACQRYLVATRGASADTYEQVEEAAWRELLRALERLGLPSPERVGVA